MVLIKQLDFSIIREVSCETMAETERNPPKAVLSMN